MSEAEGVKSTRLDTKTMSPPARRLYEFLSARVKGQDRALKEVVSAFELQISGIDRGDHPKFVGLFLGPSGVGKTLVAEALAESFFGDKKAFTKIEGATYSQPHQVALLIGSPPGYIGFNQEANSASYPLLSQFNIDKHGFLAYQFTPEATTREERIKKLTAELRELGKNLARMKEAKKDTSEDFKKKYLEYRKLKAEKEKLEEEKNEAKKKFLAGGEPQFDSIVLFDEIEKAHPDVWNTFLEITDKGRLTLSNGNITDFRRSYIIITSNIGSGEIKDILSDAHVGFKSKVSNGNKAKNAKDQEIYTVARQEASETFPPEFLGRLDAIVVFRPLDREAMRAIFGAQKLELMKELNASGLYIQLNIDEAAINFIIDQATKRSDYGARLLKHRIDEYIKKPLARLKNWGKEKGIIKGDIVEIKFEMIDGRNRLVFYRHERTESLDGGAKGDTSAPGNGKLEVLDPEDEGELLSGNHSE